MTIELKPRDASLLLVMAMNQTHRGQDEQDALYLLADEICSERGVPGAEIVQEIEDTWESRDCKECGTVIARQTADGPTWMDGDLCVSCYHEFQ